MGCVSFGLGCVSQMPFPEIPPLINSAQSSMANIVEQGDASHEFVQVMMNGAHLLSSVVVAAQGILGLTDCTFAENELLGFAALAQEVAQEACHTHKSKEVKWALTCLRFAIKRKVGLKRAVLLMCLLLCCALCGILQYGDWRFRLTC